MIFGRLADGISSVEAQAELATVGLRMAMEFPDTHAGLEPEVVPFALGLFGVPKRGLQTPEFYLIQVLALLLLVCACDEVSAI